MLLNILQCTDNPPNKYLAKKCQQCQVQETLGKGKKKKQLPLGRERNPGDGEKRMNLRYI